MRILQVAPPWETVPPPAYGGTELVVSLLTEELVRQGHDVTLIAAGDSRTSARLKAPYLQSLRHFYDVMPPHDVETMDWLYTAEALREAANEFDIVHNHHGELPMLFAAQAAVPMVTTLHGKPSPVFDRILDYYSGMFTCISRSHAAQYPDRSCLGVVYHGIDVETFPFEANKDDYLLFLSRISPEKGPLEAIEVAKRLGMRLLIAGKVSHVDRPFHEEQVMPLVDGDQIVFLGEANYREKRELYKRARCLLMPLQWEEPFGLVMVEAPACGTPVVALRRGAAPELIVDGISGFVVDSVDQMVEAVRHIDEVRPEDCRRHIETNFSVERMANEYLELYRKVMGLSAHAPLTPAA